jgi:ADP-ribose pyrophosphatase YjhB (NUDIX family)
MEKDLPRFAVTALVLIAGDAAHPGDRSLLLVRQNYGRRYWSLPGGSVDPGESVDQAAVDSYRAETGVFDKRARFCETWQCSRDVGDRSTSLFLWRSLCHRS